MLVDLEKDIEFVKQLKSNKDYEIFLYFIRVSTIKNVTVFKLSFDEKIEEDFLEYFLDLKVDTPQDIFSPIKSGEIFYQFEHDKIIEKTDEDLDNETNYKYHTFHTAVDLIDTNSNRILEELKKTRLHNLSGYAVQIRKKKSNKRILYFSQFEKFTSLKKGSGIMTNVTNDEVKRLKKEDTIGLKSLINCYIGLENKALITSKNNFEQMFKMGDIYVEEAERVMTSIPQLTSTFSNYNDFSTHVKRDSRLSKRIASLDLKKDRVELVCKNIPIVKHAIKEPEYKNKIGRVKIKDDKIVYEKDNVDQIITLLSDLAAESYITRKKFVADSD